MSHHKSCYKSIYSLEFDNIKNKKHTHILVVSVCAPATAPGRHLHLPTHPPPFVHLRYKCISQPQKRDVVNEKRFRAKNEFINAAGDTPVVCVPLLRSARPVPF